MALPLELSLAIVKHLEVDDKARFSATCKAYRTQLMPEICKTICFTNKESSAKSALIAVEAFGEYTTRLEFTCLCSPGEEFTTPTLPPAAVKILQGHLLPNLETIRLKFECDFSDGEEWDDHPDSSNGFSIYVFEGVEDENQVREMEQQWKWRALMKETWEALAANTSVVELILDQFIPKWTTTFRTDEFRQFLSRLQSATFKIYGTDNGAGWKTNTVWGYVDFLAHLDDPFFHHMTGLKHLYIHAEDPLGLSGFRHIPLALKPSDLPALESLKLVNCYVGPELVSFIGEHSALLKSLDIEECVSAGDGGSMAENPLYWAEFFDLICEARPSSLTSLIAGGGNVPLTDDEAFTENYDVCDNTAEPDNVKEIRQKLKDDSRLKLFGYASMDDKYGMFFKTVEENVQQFVNGTDQRAYERLMALVTKNAARADEESN